MNKLWQSQIETQVSILLKLWFEMDILARIDRREYIPVPQVDTVLAMFKKGKVLFKGIFTLAQKAIVSREIGVGVLKPTELTIE